MKVIIVAVSSLNGKITKVDDENIYSWTSPEDQKFFFSLIKKNNLIVMGKNTYLANKKIIKPEKNKLRIVMTKNPERFEKEEIKGQLEFSEKSPLQLVKYFENKNYKQMLVVGGSQINSAFLKEKQVSEIYLTVEPKIFGQGKLLFSEDQFESPLKLISLKKINNQGTLLLRYSIMTT